MKHLTFFALALAACGGKASPAGTGPSNGGGGDATRLPWEAALTQGARFELAPEMADEGGEATPIAVTVTSIEDAGAARIYHLSWGEEGSGPSTIHVESGKVRIGDATLEQMQEPWSDPSGATCYAEDYSNPDGCEDVCDANLCLDADGIVSVGGLYAPGYLPYARK